MANVRTWVLAIIVVAVIVLGIGISRAAGFWVTETTRTPALISTGEFTGEYNPADIRGSYTFGDIENAFDIPADLLAEAFGLASAGNPAEIRLNELEETYAPTADGGEVGTDSVRLFVSIYNGVPYYPEETTKLPGPALGILEDKLSTADYAVLQERSVSLSEIRLEPAGTGEATAAAETHDPGTEEIDSEEHEDEDGIIRGTTTYNDLLTWGLTREQIEGIIGMEMGPRPMTLRDHLMENGGSFGSAKAALQALLDTMN